MPFWTVEDAGPYKEESNILMRSLLCRLLFAFFRIFIPLYIAHHNTSAQDSRGYT